MDARPVSIALKLGCTPDYRSSSAIRQKSGAATTTINRFIFAAGEEILDALNIKIADPTQASCGVWPDHPQHDAFGYHAQITNRLLRQLPERG